MSPGQNSPETSLIDSVSDPPSIGDLSRDIDERIPRYVVILAEEVEVEHRAFAVAVGELVLDVPTQRSKLLTFLGRKVV